MSASIADIIMRGGQIFVPSTTTTLEGITRDSLLTVARDLGYTSNEQIISRDQIHMADEVFVCDSAAEAIALREIDFRVTGSDKMSPVTHRLQQAYQAAIHGRESKYRHWLTPVK